MDELPLADIIPPVPTWAEPSSSMALAWPLGIACGLAIVWAWTAWRRMPIRRLRRLIRRALVSTQRPYDKATFVAREARSILGQRAPHAMEAHLTPALERLDEERFRAVPDAARVQRVLADIDAALRRTRA